MRIKSKLLCCKKTMLAIVILLGVSYSAILRAESYSRESLNINQTSRTVKGKIVDAAGEPLIGVTVSIVGATIGAMTDIDGRYSIDAPNGSGQLKVSYIGYKDQFITIGDKMEINITMQEDEKQLQEVVVVGYGSQRKATLTGAVTVVDGKVMENKGALSSPVQALQGQVPGVIITRSSSAPGDESWSMSLRGAASKNETPPLIIIDGVEYGSVNDLRLLNPSDIESMNFLKDAAASIYGSKAAGGVVLVQTKKAKEGKTRIEYSGSVNAKFVGLSPKLMSLNQWADAVIQARTNDGYKSDDTWMKYANLALANRGHYIDLDNTRNPIAGAFNDVADYVFFDTDWQKIMWGTSASTQHELGISGGNDKATYRVSLGYMYDDSTLKWGNNNNNRYNFRLSNSFKLTNALTLESVVAYNRQDQVSPTQIASALATSTQQPGFPSATANGKPYSWGTWGAPNWHAELGGDNRLRVSAINISEIFKYTVSKELTAVVTTGYNTSNALRDEKSNTIDWYNYAGTRLVKTSPTQDQSSYTKATARTDYYSLSGYLQWGRVVAKDHDIKIMGGAEYNLKESERTEIIANNILSSLEVINGSGKVSINAKDNATERWQEAIMSYFSRANYSYKDRYMLDGLLRHDGSSKFQPINRWSTYGSVSGGWRISEESFMLGIKDYVGNLKLRMSYGTVGSQSGIDRYDGVQFYSFKPAEGALIGNGKISYMDTNGKLATLDRTWELTHNYNLGLDFGFLNNRLNGTVELFMKKCNNMLIDISYPAVLGDKAPTVNKGKFKNTGWEGMITWSDKVGDVNYNVGTTYTYINPKLVDNGGDAALKSGVVQREGYPLNSVFGLRYAGKIQTQEQLDKYKGRYAANSTIGDIQGLRLGDNMFEDVNKDGKLTEEDYVYLGSDDPKISFSFNAGIEWKGFDFSAIFQGVGKRTIFRDGTWRTPMYAVYQNSTTQSIGNVWSPSTPDARYPSYTNAGSINTYNYQCSSWSVEDGSYIRLKNITLGYSLPAGLLAKSKVLTKARLYVTGTDLWEHSKINDGWDPEATRKVTKTGRYPFTRSLTIGANLTF